MQSPKTLSLLDEFGEYELWKPDFIIVMHEHFYNYSDFNNIGRYELIKMESDWLIFLQVSNSLYENENKFALLKNNSYLMYSSKTIVEIRNRKIVYHKDRYSGLDASYNQTKEIFMADLVKWLKQGGINNRP